MVGWIIWLGPKFNDKYFWKRSMKEEKVAGMRRGDRKHRDTAMGQSGGAGRAHQEDARNQFSLQSLERAQTC